MIAALLRWLREEVRLLGIASWSEGAYQGPPEPLPCTSSDPRCQKTIERLAEVNARMYRMRTRLIDGKPVTSAAATDIRHTIAQALATKAPPVQLVRRKAK